MQAGWTADDEAVLQQLRPAGLLPGGNGGGPAGGHPPLLLVHNKCDLAGGDGGGGDDDGTAAGTAADATVPEAWRAAVSGVVQTSARTGAGLDALKQAVLTLTDSPQLASGKAAVSADFHTPGDRTRRPSANPVGHCARSQCETSQQVLQRVCAIFCCQRFLHPTCQAAQSSRCYCK